MRALTAPAGAALAVALAATAVAGPWRDPPPHEYNLRDVDGVNYVTSVKNQTGGTCWTHGVMAALESNLLVTGAWAAAGDTGEPSLAEYHLDWWNGFNEFYNSDIVPPTGEGVHVHWGGDYRMTAAYLTRGDGAVRDVDGQLYSAPPPLLLSRYHRYYPRHIEWLTAGPDLENIDTLKRYIMEHGAAATCVLVEGDGTLNGVHYQPPSYDVPPNHAIAVVGWSDGMCTPAPGPGAWLCKNSWGVGWGMEGYFWISYYDKHTAQHPELGFVSFRDIEPFAYHHVYYHDYHGWRDEMEGVTEALNAFTAERDEGLAAVSFFTAADSVVATASVFGSFEGGVLADFRCSVVDTFAHRGAHTVDLPDTVTLSRGDRFYLHLALSRGGIPYDRTSTIDILMGARYRTTVRSSAEPGQSFYLAPEGWLDLTGVEPTGNFCIKGLTLRDGMFVSPALGFYPQGSPGGAPHPGAVTYTVEHEGGTPFAYRVALDPPVSWADISSPTTGTLASGQAVDVTVELNENAPLLPHGLHTTTLVFENLTTHHGDTAREIAVTIGASTLRHAWDLDTDPGWSMQNLWAWGVPRGYGGHAGTPDPTSGHTGQNVYGYNLNGDYGNNTVSEDLTTSAIDCSGAFATRLTFWRWAGVEEPTRDKLSVLVSADGVSWTTAWENPTEICDTTWVFMDLDISSVADDAESVYVRWRVGPTDGANRCCGWNIDDIEIWGMSLAPPPAEPTIAIGTGRPNPFRQASTIQFLVTDPAPVELAVYDVSGRLVRVLASGPRPAGPDTVTWDGRDEAGRRVAAGVYFARLTQGETSVTSKLALIR
jgi:C1A family cysteine protease